MLVTLVIRLVAEELAKGEVIGRVEHVGSGEQATVRGVDELVGFARRHAAGGQRESSIPIDSSVSKGAL